MLSTQTIVILSTLSRQLFNSFYDMSFIVNFENGKFSLGDSITPSCWCEMKNADRHDSSVYICRFFRFDNSPKFSFESRVYLRKLKSEDGFNYTSVHVGIKDKNDEHIYYVHFESHLPFCQSNMNNVEQAFICFLNTIYIFNSAEDAHLVISTKNVFDYSEPNALIDRIEKLSMIVDKYGKDKLFFIKDQIVDWIQQAMQKFGYSFVKLKQLDEQFPNTIALLNSLGYSVIKL